MASEVEAVMVGQQSSTTVLSLAHLTGTRRGEQETFTTDRISIGRGRNNHCSFDPEKERSVSHRHCEIRLEDNIPIIYDIGSLNGTYVNGRRVRRAPLAEGDEIGLGREGPRLRFLMTAGRPPDPARLEELRPALAGTAQEQRPTGLERIMMQHRLTRYRGALISVSVLLVLLAGVGVWVVHHLQSRIDDLKDQFSDVIGEAPGNGISATRDGSGTPATAPVTPGAASGVLFVRFLDAGGRPVSASAPLGVGSLVGPGLVLTDDLTLKHLRKALGEARDRASPSLSLTGRPEDALPIAGYLEPGASDLEILERAVVLLLAAEARCPPPPRIELGAGTRILRTSRGGEGQLEVAIDERLDNRGWPVGAEAPAATLKVMSTLTPGTALMDGTALGAVVLAPGRAVAAAALLPFVEATRQGSPLPLR